MQRNSIRRAGVSPTPKLTSPAEVQVRVSLDNQRSVGEQLRVDLLNQSSVPTHITFTDSAGRAWFKVAEAGEYHVRVSGNGIQDATSDGIRVDDAHRLNVAVVHVKPRFQALTSTQPKTKALTSASDLAVPPDAKKLFHDGIQALQSHEYVKARAAFENAITHYSRYDAAYNNLGVVYVYLNQPTKAWTAFEQAVRINDKNADADRNFSRLLIQTQAFKRAVQLLKKSLVVDPLSASALTLACTAEIAIGDYDAALHDAQKVHELPHEGFAVSHYIAGRVLEHKNQWQDATGESNCICAKPPMAMRYRTCKPPWRA